MKKGTGALAFWQVVYMHTIGFKKREALVWVSRVFSITTKASNIEGTAGSLVGPSLLPNSLFSPYLYFPLHFRTLKNYLFLHLLHFFSPKIYVFKNFEIILDCMFRIKEKWETWLFYRWSLPSSSYCSRVMSAFNHPKYLPTLRHFRHVPQMDWKAHQAAHWLNSFCHFLTYWIYAHRILSWFILSLEPSRSPSAIKSVTYVEWFISSLCGSWSQYPASHFLLLET